MKAFGFLLFVVVAVQARSAGVQVASGTPAQAGENPWLVHLRLANSNTNGLLTTCLGSIINERWVLTAASCVSRATFIWIRYGAIDAIRPVLVTETSRVTLNDENDVALIDINRIVQFDDQIAAISLAEADAEVPESGKLCGYGGDGEVPGEALSCFDVSLEAGEGSAITGTSDEQPTQFDIGAPLVVDGVQVGVLTAVEDGKTVFVNPANYKEWIDSVINP